MTFPIRFACFLLTIHINMDDAGDRSGQVRVGSRAGQLGVQKGAVNRVKTYFISDTPIA